MVTLDSSTQNVLFTTSTKLSVSLVAGNYSTDEWSSSISSQATPYYFSRSRSMLRNVKPNHSMLNTKNSAQNEGKMNKAS